MMSHQARCSVSYVSAAFSPKALRVLLCCPSSGVGLGAASEGFLGARPGGAIAGPLRAAGCLPESGSQLLPSRRCRPGPPTLTGNRVVTSFLLSETWCLFIGYWPFAPHPRDPFLSFTQRSGSLFILVICKSFLYIKNMSISRFTCCNVFSWSLDSVYFS